MATSSVGAAQAQECENLMRVVRELTESRSKLVAGKCVMAEKFAELQQEYMKVCVHVNALTVTADNMMHVQCSTVTEILWGFGESHH